MPALSLVVCLYNERDLLERLLRNSEGCYDDLVVVHDGPETGGTRALVESYGGRFFERPREYQQEPHWPFAWGEAKCDWILRFDADEFPSEEMKAWLNNFRKRPEPSSEISGFTCIWPIWNGYRAISERWPADRNFLFNKQRVRFFGMAEQAPIPDGKLVPLDLKLRHEVEGRKMHSLGNVLFRKRAKIWRVRIADSLMKAPTDLSCWRWNAQEWPQHWQRLLNAPLRSLFGKFTIGLPRTLRDQWRTERRVYIAVALTSPLQELLIAVRLWQQKSASKKERI